MPRAVLAGVSPGPVEEAGEKELRVIVEPTHDCGMGYVLDAARRIVQLSEPKVELHLPVSFPTRYRLLGQWAVQQPLHS